jgi:hypothetical protein
MEPQAAILAASLVQHIQMGLDSSPRSRQPEVGASQVGQPCLRQLAYKHQGYPRFNYTDPMRLLTGIGIHLALAQIFADIAPAPRRGRNGGRFMVEYQVEHYGVPGTLDLYDRGTATLIDWKTTSKKRMNEFAKTGPPVPYVVQAQIYAAGLINAGYPVKRIALAFLPYDGALESMWVWLSTPDPTVANEAIERFHEFRDTDVREVPAKPDRYCGYCDFYNPQSKDLRLGCPGT